MEFWSEKKIESGVIPGVSFTIREATEGLVTAIRLRTATSIGKVRSIEEQRADAYDRIEESIGRPLADVNMEELKRRDQLTLSRFLQDVDLIEKAEIHPEYFRACFVKVEGISIQGSDNPNADEVREHGPILLYREIMDAILKTITLSPEERINLKSPTTSAAVEGGKATATAAPSAETQEIS